MINNPAEHGGSISEAQLKYGMDALTAEEAAMLSWDPDTELAAFRSVNPDMDEKILLNKIMYFKNHVGTHQIFDMLKDLGNPYVGWEKIRDILLSETAESDSHYGRHELRGIKFPPSYEKAYIENNRQSYLDFRAASSE